LKKTRILWTLDWQAKGGILAEGTESEPTKPSEPGSVGFEGASTADSPEIDAETEQARSARRMLNEMSWYSKGIAWADWKACALNRLFQEQGTSGQPGKITAASVCHGERKR
jgi:hypothetical protein